jgi:hypothetical protein
MTHCSTLNAGVLRDAPALIESVFPAQKVCFEAQKERKAEEIVGANLGRWQHEGVVPDMAIEPGDKTDLEQRIGRIKRFGQKRSTVDMLNLVNEQTVDEKIYDRLSDRMRDRYDLFGSVPDTIKEEWIDDIEAPGLKLGRDRSRYRQGEVDQR